jgi:hypothetical protein
MTVRAKFRVRDYSTAVDNRPTGEKDENGTPILAPVEVRTINLVPVYSQDPGSENHTFWKYTPSGAIQLGTINPAAWEQFELNREYYVDFTPAAD